MIPLVESAWHVISAFLVFCIGLLVCLHVGRRLHLKASRSCALYLWHTLFCFFYVLYVNSNGGDAIGYYNRGAMSLLDDPALGTTAVDMMAAALIHGLGLSFLGLNLTFNVFGTIGLLAFHASLEAELKYKPRWVRQLGILAVFSPSVSFWTSALGKDPISFMSAGAALWASLDLNRRAKWMTLAIGAMLIVRPHMAGIMVLALGLALTFSARLGLLKRVALLGAALGGAAILVPLALEHAGTSADAAELAEYIEGRQGVNLEGGSSIDISSMSLPLQVFTYLFRPLPFEAHSLAALAASIDNVLLLLLFFVGFRGVFRRRRAYLPAFRTFLWTYAGAAALILAMTTANSGIAVRQKWMFVPMLIFLLLSLSGSNKSKKFV